MKEYTYCPCCKSTDEKGYRGKRCKWCATLLIKDPLNEIFVKKHSSFLIKKDKTVSAKEKVNEEYEYQTNGEIY